MPWEARRKCILGGGKVGDIIVSMVIINRLLNNQCIDCIDGGVNKANYIDIGWRDQINKGYWPKPYSEQDYDPDKVKGIVLGQDPTIDKPRPIEFVLEANNPSSKLGHFIRDLFSMIPNVRFDELYFTNIVKCRLKEKPGKGGRSISEFLDGLARYCYRKFLTSELELFAKAHYIFTLGRDSFTIIANILGVQHESLTQFNKWLGEPLGPVNISGSERFIVALPHQPTYDLATRYYPYCKNEIGKKLANIRVQ